MSTILIWNEGKQNETRIGAYHFPDRKKPSLAIAKGNIITQYGIFNNEESAEDFMKILGELVGAIDDTEVRNNNA